MSEVKSSLTETSATERLLEVTIPAAQLQDSLKKKLSEYSRKMSLPGFRPGKVPAAVIQARFGGAIRQEAMESLVDQTIKAEFEARSLRPVAPGDLAEFKDDADGIKFQLKVEVDPEITVVGYENLGVTPAPVIIDQAEVDKELEAQRRRLAEEKPAAGKAAKGNVVHGHYVSIEIDGEEQPLAEDPHFHSEVGASDLPGFDAGLDGLAVGDEKTIRFVFPDSYANATLRGKKAVYAVKVEAVNELVLPELSDEFAQKIGAADLATLRADVLGYIQNFREDASRRAAHQQAMDALLAQNNFPVPEARVRHYASRSLNKEEVTSEEIEQVRAKAEHDLRAHRILDFVANSQGLKAKQAEVDARVARMAGMYGVSFQELRDHLRQSGKMVEIREEIRLEKANDWLVGVREESAPAAEGAE